MALWLMDAGATLSSRVNFDNFVKGRILTMKSMKIMKEEKIPL